MPTSTRKSTSASCDADNSIKETATCELSDVTKLPESTNCMACSEDGAYLSLGHSKGLSVWSAVSLTCVGEWLQERLEMTSIQMATMTEMTYLLGTVDDMGVARVLAYHSEGIHLLHVINNMEDINKRSICLSFQLSKGGEYGAAAFSCSGAVWLEVYHFPTETWLKELEMMSQRQDPNSSGVLDVKWSPVAVIIEIKPSETLLEGPLKPSQMKDFQTHCLALDRGTSSPQQQETFNTDNGQTNERSDRLRHCTVHFLLPLVGGTKGKPARFPVAVCVWWSSSCNLLQYLLQKPQKNKPDVKVMPDVLWPNANEILCSAVSGCTRYVALGLRDAVVCVWDRQLGSPLSVFSVSNRDSVFSKIRFVDYWPVSSDDPLICSTAELHLLVICKSGAMHAVKTGRGRKPSTLEFIERPKDNGDLQTITASVPFLQGLSLVVQRNGKIFLQDVINKTIACFLSLPASYLVASPCSPVYALNINQQTLYIRGDPKPSSSAFLKEDCQSHLYILKFGERDVFKPYIVSPSNSPRQERTFSFVSLAEACNVYLQQRVGSVEERNNAVTQTWKRLPETALMVQKRNT
ncbi:WD repeat-containing protein 93 [Sphaeramia orbicularis]|uniref:WD repeat-containing protein 93 n=1 Tax=Sphaeramia orbicularis TaxID=375764 RepID=UPI00117DEA2D|nr:WD repeat-containing protein 93 [Sphaeramia orbicularis]